MLLAVINSTLFYAMLEGRDLVEINTTSGVTSIGVPIQKELKKLDAGSLFLLPKTFTHADGIDDIEKHITVGDKNGYYHTKIGTADWKYVTTKPK